MVTALLLAEQQSLSSAFATRTQVIYRAGYQHCGGADFAGL